MAISDAAALFTIKRSSWSRQREGESLKTRHAGPLEGRAGRCLGAPPIVAYGAIWRVGFCACQPRHESNLRQVLHCTLNGLFKFSQRYVKRIAHASAALNQVGQDREQFLVVDELDAELAMCTMNLYRTEKRHHQAQ